MWKFTKGNLTRVDGCAASEIRNTTNLVTAVASLCGPQEVRATQELAAEATLDISIRPLHGVADFPRSLIQVVIQSSTASAQVNHLRTVVYLNAASAALVRAGSVPMSDLADVDGVGTFAFVFPAEELVWSEWRGIIRQEEMPLLISLGRENARIIYGLMRSGEVA
ncbi:hypothetical protein DL93DRAFT_1818996 [Clavulina sp. PMI_390]|nr:hypothetical protein DL93DRAFT_1818996 [Clavulina sp. PMI_390]